MIKKKLILQNLSRINDSTLRDDTSRNEKSTLEENIENIIPKPEIPSQPKPPRWLYTGNSLKQGRRLRDF